MTIHDSHIHVGQFEQEYYSPKSILAFLDQMKVSSFAVSSTTICSGNYQNAIMEILHLLRMAESRCVPVLWITPKLLKSGHIDFFINSGINWKCVKIHGFHDWSVPQIDKAVELSGSLGLPLLLHTGGSPRCEAGGYYSLCKSHPHQIFIFAHSRPADQTIKVMLECENVWADTAFTPIKDIVQMVSCNLEDRIMWGSDYPIPHMFYPHKNIGDMYVRKVAKLKSTISDIAFSKIIGINFERFYLKEPSFCASIIE